MTVTYHLVCSSATDAACVIAGIGTVADGDQLVSAAEADDPAGRHFNCPLCHGTLTGGLRHVPPPDGWEDLDG